jgi:Family of unknown function (DUF5670)
MCGSGQTADQTLINVNPIGANWSQLLLIHNFRDEVAMLYTIAVVLLILWFCGLVTSYTMGGFIHVLLVIALVMVLLRVISGRALI